jgi:hypothetical protein
VLLRLAYLGLTNTFAMLRLLPMTDRDKDIEILALRHQIGVLQRQLGDTRVRFSPADRALLAAPAAANSASCAGPTSNPTLPTSALSSGAKSSCRLNGSNPVLGHVVEAGPQYMRAQSAIGARACSSARPLAVSRYRTVPSNATCSINPSFVARWSVSAKTCSDSMSLSPASSAVMSTLMAARMPLSCSSPEARAYTTGTVHWPSRRFTASKTACWRDEVQ